MSEKKQGYRLEYAASNRSKCKGHSAGSPIAKGELRFGTIVDIQGKTSFQWRHWGCVTERVLSNVKNLYDKASDMDGFDELEDEDKARVARAWEENHVADEDIPDSARKDGDNNEDE
ncbi:hypothetical protein C8R43DRAFT_919079, partial [Mycena crocata]